LRLPQEKGRIIAFVIRCNGGHQLFAEGEQRKLINGGLIKKRDQFTKADGFIGSLNRWVIIPKNFLQIGNRPIRVNHVIRSTYYFFCWQASFNEIYHSGLVFAELILRKKGFAKWSKQ